MATGLVQFFGVTALPVLAAVRACLRSAAHQTEIMSV